MRWEHQLMGDMLERARQYEDVQTFDCAKTAAMLKQAATVMLHWDRQIIELQTQLQERDALIAVTKEIRR